MLHLRRGIRSLHTKFTGIGIADTLPRHLSGLDKSTLLHELKETCECSFKSLETTHHLKDRFEPIHLNSPSANIGQLSHWPNEIPSFKSHVLLIAPNNSQNKWASKIELDSATYPYNVVGPLKNSLKNCSIMVNIISFDEKHLGNHLGGYNYDSKVLKFLCIPEMALVEIPRDDQRAMERFTEYLEFKYRENDKIYNPFANSASVKDGQTEILPKVDAIKITDVGLIKPVVDNFVFVCSHMKRDNRCGFMAPLLMSEVQKWNDKQPTRKYVYGSISHIGGHKFAGNLAIYQEENDIVDGLWFKQVTPSLTPLLLNSLQENKIIKELYRGHFRHTKS